MTAHAFPEIADLGKLNVRSNRPARLTHRWLKVAFLYISVTPKRPLIYKTHNGGMTDTCHLKRK